LVLTNGEAEARVEITEEGDDCYQPELHLGGGLGRGDACLSLVQGRSPNFKMEGDGGSIDVWSRPDGLSLRLINGADASPQVELSAGQSGNGLTVRGSTGQQKWP
jgi:hypothetical protein